MALIALAALPLGAATRVALPASVTGQTLDGSLVGSSPFDPRPSVDGITGDLLFRAALSGGPAPQALLRLSAGTGNLGVLRAAGDEAGGGLAFDSFLSPSGCAGRVTFWAGLTGAGSGVFILDQGEALAAAMAGAAAPGGGTYLALGSGPRVDAGGRLTFFATTSDSPDDLILFSRTPGGTTTPILAVGDTAVDGSPILALLDTDLTCDGTLLVLATLERTAGPRQAVLREIGSAWEPLIAQDDPLPDGTSVVGLKLPAAVTADDGVHLVADRGAVPGQALVTVDASGGLAVMAAAGDSAGGGTLLDVGPPTPLSAGQVAWRSRLDGGDFPAGASPQVILAAGPGTPATVLVAPGDPSPGQGMILELGDPVGRGDGTLHLLAGTAGDATGEGMLAWTASAAWSARAGQSVPGWGRLLGGGFRTARPGLDAAGQAAFIATLSAGDGGEALYLGAPGQPPRRLLAPGDTLSGGESLVGLAGPATPAAAGTVWVAADISDGNERTGYIRAVEGNSAEVELFEGDPSPLGGEFRTLGRVPSANAGDKLLFTATLAGAGASAGIFTLDAGMTPAPVVASGTPAPAGGDFASFGFAPALAGTGAAFMGFTAGNRAGSGIFAADLTTQPPSLSALARSGDTAPAGGTMVSFRDPVGSADGTVAFVAGLDDGSSSILASGGSGLERLLTTGDVLSDGKTVTAITSLAADGTGTVYAAVEAATATSTALVLALDGITTQVVLGGGGAMPLGGGALATLENFPALGAGGNGNLVMAAGLQGWSAGAAVIHAALDSDGDGWGDPADCAPSQASAWAVPPAIMDLQVLPPAGAMTGLTWTALAAAAGSGTTAEILTGGIAELRQSGGVAGASCAAAGISGGNTAFSEGIPAVGTATWYLVRGRNACGVGALAAGTARSVPAAVCAAP